MNTITTPRPDEEFDPYEEEPTEQLPRRRRRQWLTWRSAVLGALVTCAVGFYVGIRVEKGQLSGSGSSATSAAGLSSRAGGTSGARSGLAALFSRAGRTGAATGGPGGGSFGTVASVSGRTLYVTQASGNTVKVRLSSATKVSKTQSVSRSSIHPGDTVVVQGVSGSGGTVSAASVTDSGRGAGVFGAAGASGGSAGSGQGSARSAVGSLFSSGG